VKYCKFPGMTRTKYEHNMHNLLGMCMLLRVRFPDLNADGTPQPIMLPPKFIDISGMYRVPERPRTGIRETARRRRQAES
jgi:hypothetical protein